MDAVDRVKQMISSELWDALAALRQMIWASAAAAAVSPITVTYVAPNGSNATGQRGSISRPFATIQAAVTASQSGDVIVIAPKPAAAPDYNENIVIPPALTALTLRGESRFGVSIRPTVGAAVTYVPSGTAGLLELHDLTIACQDGTSDAVAMSAPLPARSSFTAVDCAIGQMTITEVRDVEDVVGTHGTVTFTNCTNVAVKGSTIGRLGDGFDGATTALPRGQHRYEGVTITSTISLIGQIDAFFDGGCSQPTGAAFQVAGTTRFAGGDDLGCKVTTRGQHGTTTISVDPNAVGLTDLSAIDIQHATFVSSVSVTLTAANPDASLLPVEARGANIDGALTADRAAVDARGANITGVLTGLNGGTVDRLLDTRAQVNADDAGVAVTIDPPLPNANYSVSLEYVGGVAGSGLSCVVSAKTATGFTVAHAAASPDVTPVIPTVLKPFQ